MTVKFMFNAEYHWGLQALEIVERIQGTELTGGQLAFKEYCDMSIERDSGRPTEGAPQVTPFSTVLLMLEAYEGLPDNAYWNFWREETLGVIESLGFYMLVEGIRNESE